MDMREVEVLQVGLVDVSDGIAFFVLAIGTRPRNEDGFRWRLLTEAGRCGWASNSGEPDEMGDDVLAMVQCDEETVPHGCEGTDVKHTVSFRAWTDGCET